MLPGFWTLTAISIINGLVLLVSYVASNSFPKPLSEKEENRYLEMFMSGDETARQVLIERNLRLVAHIIKKFDSGDEFDDLVSIGTIGLIKAINTFKPDKAIRLATYASRCIENEILMHYRSRRKNRGECSLHDPIGMDKEGNELSLLDVLGSDPEEVLDQVSSHLEQERLWSKLIKLSAQERRVLIMRFGLKNGFRYTQKDIAKTLGISRSYVSRIEKRALNRLNTHYLEEAY